MDREQPLEQTLLDGRRAMLDYIRRKVDDSIVAEDILQDSLLRALRGVEKLNDPGAITGWFRRIVDNAVIDYYRKRGVERKHTGAFPDVENKAIEEEEERRACLCLRRVLPTLRPDDATLIEELDLKHRDTEEIAERLDITRGALKVRRHRAHNRLRLRLEETCRVCATHGCIDCTCVQPGPEQQGE